MSKKSAKKIVEAAMPNVEVVDTPSAKLPDTIRQVTRPGPSLEQLRKRYGADEIDADAAVEDDFVGNEDEDDVDIVKIRNKQSSADPADDPGPRIVIVSKKHGIIGSQG